jgi:hypothetical protein
VTTPDMLPNGTHIRYTKDPAIEMTGIIVDWTVDTSRTPPKVEYLIAWDNEWYDSSEIAKAEDE